VARHHVRVVEPGHVPGAIHELQPAAGQQADCALPNLHTAHRVGGAVDEERRLWTEGRAV
jgi:hypothetical protein